jgi:hypothetical protein
MPGPVLGPSSGLLVALLVHIRHYGKTGKGEEEKMVQKLVIASTSLLPHESFK